VHPIYKSIGHPIGLNIISNEQVNMTEECCPETEICPPGCCDMRGMLSFLILWQLSKKPMYGDEIAKEIGKMKGGKPTPGTIYPALKQLRESGSITSEKEGRKIFYSLTQQGKNGTQEALNYFCTAFGEIFEDYKNRRLIPPTSIE
jgi:DNA-binding PadR family transcriptional regulator